MQPDDIVDWVSEHIASGDTDAAARMLREEGHCLPNAKRTEMWDLVRSGERLPM